MQSWAHEQLADLQETYAGCWNIWYVFNGPVKRGYTWCARPIGAQVATVNADSPEELVDKLGILMCQCPKHADQP